MSNQQANMNFLQNASQRGATLSKIDEGWILELSGATLSWLIDEPIIAIVALFGKGLLKFYEKYLGDLPQDGRIEHIVVRNLAISCGLLLALPSTITATPLHWIVASVVGTLLAWMVLLAVGCKPTTKSTTANYEQAQLMPIYVNR